MDLINRVFKAYLNMFILVFIDDILIYSWSEGEHMDHFRVALQTLREESLFAKFDKCGFWLKEVAFLGHVVSNGRIKFDPKKMKMVRNWPQPLTLTDIRSFLSLARYYRIFVKSFSSILFPLTKLNKKKVKLVWIDKKCFQALKDW